MPLPSNGRGVRSVDRLAIAAIALFVVELLIVIGVRGRLPLGNFGAVGFVAAMAIVVPAAVLAVRGRFGAVPQVAARVLVLAAVLGAVVVFSRRWPEGPERSLHDEAAIGDSALMDLDLDQRLRWAVRVAAHAISTGGLRDSILTIPPAWAFPPRATISLYRAADSLVVSATEVAGTLTCRFALYERIELRAGRHDPVGCGGNPVAHSRLLHVTRDTAPVRAVRRPEDRRGVSWTQYRRDASRTGAVTGHHAGTAWRAALDGEVRSTASVAGATVLIGTHGPGALQAIDATSGRTNWMRYLPNWIHQDVVSDGATAVVGFGDNTTSLIGQAPSGVSAFSLATGDLLWTAFEGNSVMASALLRGDTAVYVTSAGMMKVRDLRTGAEHGRLKLPGRATMAPPAMVGDTLVASLDTAYVCAVRIGPLERLWCSHLAGVGMMGHAAPTVSGQQVFVTAGVFKTKGRFGLSGGQWYQTKAVLGWVGKNAPDFGYDGQRVWALDLATGRVRWQSKVYPSERGPLGHVSGTMAVESGVAVVILPLAGKMVAFDPASGREIWTQEVGGSRGPVGHTGGHLVLTLNSGELRVVEAATGVTVCSIPTGAMFDRAGPAIADSTVFLGLQKGVLVALPLEWLTSCRSSQVRTLVR